MISITQAASAEYLRMALHYPPEIVRSNYRLSLTRPAGLRFSSAKPSEDIFLRVVPIFKSTEAISYVQ